MKFKNIFKKETTTSVKANVEKLENNQLSKVIGGGDGDSSDPDNVLKAKHETAKNSINNVR